MSRLDPIKFSGFHGKGNDPILQEIQKSHLSAAATKISHAHAMAAIRNRQNRVLGETTSVQIEVQKNQGLKR